MLFYILGTSFAPLEFWDHDFLELDPSEGVTNGLGLVVPGKINSFL